MNNKLTARLLLALVATAITAQSIEAKYLSRYDDEYAYYEDTPAYYDDGEYVYYDDGSVGRGLLGGAATGALIGGLAGGGRGAAIGAGVGAGVGATTGAAVRERRIRRYRDGRPVRYIESEPAYETTVEYY